jgi:hypothetical protein
VEEETGEHQEPVGHYVELSHASAPASAHDGCHAEAHTGTHASAPASAQDGCHAEAHTGHATVIDALVVHIV